LSFGCYKCREALHSGNYGSMTANGFDFLRAWPASGYPRLMEFELSNVCNLECVMCSGRVSSGIRRNREGLEPLKMFYDKGFVAQLDEFLPHLKQARFYGGEPFLIEIYYEIWEAILRKNPTVDLYVLTNGTILNDRVKRLLDQGNFTINVSMDSFQKEIYEKIRVNAVLEKTLENLHHFRTVMKKKKKRLTLFITPTRLNWFEIPEMVEQCSNWNIDVYFSPAYFPEELALWNLPPEQIEEIIECYRKSNISGTINKVRFKNLIEELSYWSSGQRNDDSFLEKFREDSMQQEQIHEIVKPNISIAKGHEYKSLFIDRLRKSGLITIQQENSWVERIEKAIVTGKIESVFVYFFLQGLKPEIFAEQMQKMSDDEIVSFLIKKQEELKNTHTLI
jgi:MoaA/NifB/PqqE/SkfB family radical SAM enzyme